MVCVIVTYITDSIEDRKSTSKQVISRDEVYFIDSYKITVFLCFKKVGKYSEKTA